MFNRRGFLRTLLAAPVAAAVAVGLYRPRIDLSKVRLTKTVGQVEMTGDVWRKIQPKKDAFEAYMVDYHQMMITQRSGITARAEGSFLPDPDPYGLNI